MSALEKFGILVILVLVVIIGVVAVWGVGGTNDDGDLLAKVTDDPAYSAIPEPGGDKLPPWPDNGGTVTPPAGNGGSAVVTPPDLAANPTPPVPAPSIEPAPLPRPTPAPASEGTRSYTVRSGDTLMSISVRELGDRNLWKAIQDANPGLDPRRMKVGQKIQIPARSGSGATALVDVTPAPAPKSLAPVTPAPANGWRVNPDDGPTLAGGTQAGSGATPAASGEEYVVKKGETLSSIAKDRLGKSGDWYRILELNPGLDPRRIREGQKIKVPSAE